MILFGETVLAGFVEVFVSFSLPLSLYFVMSVFI